MATPKPIKPPRPSAPAGRPPGGQATPFSQMKVTPGSGGQVKVTPVSGGQEGPLYEEIPGRFEMKEERVTRDSFNLIKRDIVNRRTQMFEKGGEGATPEASPLVSRRGEKPEPPPVDTIPQKPKPGLLTNKPTSSSAKPASSSTKPTAVSAKPTSSGSKPTSSGSKPTSPGSKPTSSGSKPTSSSAKATSSVGERSSDSPPKPTIRGEKPTPRRPPVPRQNKPVTMTTEAGERPSRPVTMVTEHVTRPEPAARPVSVMTRPGAFPPKPSPISPKPRLSPGGSTTPETPTPTAESPEGAISVRALKDKFKDSEDQAAAPQSKPTMRLKPQFGATQNGGDGEGQSQGQGLNVSDVSERTATYTEINKLKRTESNQRSQTGEKEEEEEIYSKPPVPAKNFDVNEFQASHAAERQVRVPQGYDGVILLQGEDGEVKPQLQGQPTSPKKPPVTPKPSIEAPPRKPPRTFAHDKYVAAKIDRKSRRSSSPVTSRSSHGNQGNHSNRDNVTSAPPGEKPETINEGDDERSSIDERSSSMEERSSIDDGYSQLEEKSDTLKRRPPRPPLPSTGDTSPRPSAPGDPPPPRPPSDPPSRAPSGQDADPRWDQGFVRVREHNRRLTNEYFVPRGRGRMLNPSYEQHDDFLPLDTRLSDDVTGDVPGQLKRTKSDECLYSEPVVRGVVMDGHHGNVVGSDASFDEMGDPIYHDPADVITPNQGRPHVTSHGVHVDEEGYAVPDVRRHTDRFARQMSSPASRRKAVRRAGTMAPGDQRAGGRRMIPGGAMIENIQLQRKRSSVRDKVSRAYSVLRPRRLPQEGATAAEGCIQLTEEDDSDTEIDLEEHRKRLRYVGSVREKTNMTVNQYGRLLAQPKSPIFSLGLLVGLEKVEDTNTYKPTILAQFPAQLSEDVKTIAEFCFPDAAVWRPVTHYAAETFSFVLTNADGSRKNGYCRRVLPPGQGNRLPEVYCVISPLHAWHFYSNFLSEVEKRRNLSIEHAQDMLRAAHSKSLPRPGQEAWLWCLGSNTTGNAGKESVILKRSSNPRHDDISFNSLLSHLSTEILIKVFASILLERRVIFTAQHLSTLTTCIHGVSTLLYPFQWQHTYVPVLPGSMLDFICAPTPYIMGVLTSSQPQLQQLELDEILLVDLDNNSLLRSQGDEGRLIPKKLQKALATALKEDSDVGSSQDMVVTEAFLRLFVETCSHYTEYVVTQQDGKKVFERDPFVKAVTSKSIRMFLEWFSETQMFEVFIREKTENPTTPGLFETRVVEYREEMEEIGQSLKENVKQVGRKMLNFFLESGDKIKKKLSSGSVYV